MLGGLNKALPFLVGLLAVSGIFLSLLVMALPLIVGEGLGLIELGEMPRSEDFSAEGLPGSASPADSPYIAELRISTPPLESTDSVALRIFGEGKELGEVDCLGGVGAWEGIEELHCNATMPYNYQDVEDYSVYAVLLGEGGEYAYGPMEVRVDWGVYEDNFWGFAGNASICIGGAFLLLIFPLALAAWWMAGRHRHHEEYEGEYSISTLLSPFSSKGDGRQRVHAALSSPYFWGIELLGILFVVFYLMAAGEIWKSWAALAAFAISGLVAFIIPFLWCFAWWYADYKEREPIRILVTLFLWGMLSALMAIGVNSALGAVFALVGLGFLGAFLVAPPVEELFKGSGLLLFASHHEFDSVEDGIVFGFTIGMGFAFIENWLYLMDNPMGADVWSWLSLFLLRSVMFSANHGLYAAITGAAIGILIERKFAFPGLGLLVGVPVAALFHAVHNSGEMLISLMGLGGMVVYCLLIPLFNYGGLILLAFLFARAILSKR